MEKINQLTRTELKEQDVFLFDVVLCDNDVDRDMECFSEKALEQLQTLFVGKTGIFDHDLRSSGQTARIFETQLVTHSGQQTRDGRPYIALKANAYMVRTDSNADLIREIEGGIKKEVSISCCTGQRICSLCGADLRTTHCGHIPGQVYDGKLCSVILDDIQDAYEWSFVAVPAQVRAGVTKQFSQRFSEMEVNHMQEDSLMQEVETMLRKEVLALCNQRQTISKALCLAAEKMSVRELMDFKQTLLNEQPAEPEVQLLGADDSLGDFVQR